MTTGRISLFVSLLLLALIAATAVPPALALTTREIADRALPATVVVQAGDFQGSGLLVSPDGMVLTAFHVVDGAKSAMIKTNNGGFFPVAGFLGFNPKKDIAVLKAEGKGLASVPVGDSSALRPGDTVVAIGSPKGLENTVSEGVVSGIRQVAEVHDYWRQILLERGYAESDTLIQFTAPITHGSSGGPLLNSAGEAVGTVVLRDPREDADNVYFAVPINDAKPYLAASTVMKFETIDFTALGGGRKRIGPAPPDMGLAPAVEESISHTIAKGSEPTYALLPGWTADPSTVKVVIAGRPAKAVEAKPKAGEYRVLPDSSVVFAEGDGGKSATITLKRRAQRLALLPVLNSTGIEYVPQQVRDALVEILKPLGFELLPEAESTAVIRSEGMNLTGIRYGIGDALKADSLIAVAEKVNCRYLLLTTVDSASTDSSVQTRMAILLFDGRTGKSLVTTEVAGSKDTFFSTNKSARGKLIKNALKSAIGGHFGAVR